MKFRACIVHIPLKMPHTPFTNTFWQRTTKTTNSHVQSIFRPAIPVSLPDTFAGCRLLLTRTEKKSCVNKHYFCEVRAKFQQATGPHEDLLTTVKRRKLQWCGHVSRSSRLAQTILQGTVKGGRKQGRQLKRWEDNTREWTGLGFAKSQRAVENKEKWRKVVAKSSVVPKRPSRIRNR